MDDRYQKRAKLLVFYNSPEFKDAEKKRREESKPKEHGQTEQGWLYCPIEDARRPEWMCLYDHGDRNAEDYQGWDKEEKE